MPSPLSDKPSEAMIEGYEKRDEWVRRGDKFAVKIHHHYKPWVTPEKEPFEGKNTWCIYAVIYKDHWLFPKFSGYDFWQDALDDMPLHGGCTFLIYHYDKGEVCSVEVGCDYQHLHDDHYGFYDVDQVSMFRADAERLYDWLARDLEKAGL